MRRAIQKLRSREGASISFALLLFLVCSVVCSVVIAAGTAAAGRVSRAAEMDQRYYSVTSAVGLLRDALDGRAVVVKTVKKTGVTTRYPDRSTEALQPESTSTIDDAEVGNTAEFTLLADAARKLAGLEENVVFPQVRELTLAADGAVPAGGSGSAAPDVAALAVAIRETLDANGTLTFDVTGAGSGTGKYTLRATFMAEITRTADTHTDYGAPQPDASGYTTTDTTTETVTTTLKWRLTGVEKIKAAQTGAEEEDPE